jgi:hypothetical protein
LEYFSDFDLLFLPHGIARLRVYNEEEIFSGVGEIALDDAVCGVFIFVNGWVST